MDAPQGSAPAGTPDPAATPNPAPAAAPAAPAAQPWYSSLDADTLGWLENRGLKQDDPAAVVVKAVTGHRNAEKIIGAPAEQVIKLPKDDSPEAWGQVYDRLGRPKTADDYEIPLPQQGANEEFAKGFKAKAHEIGLTAKQAKALAEWNNGAVGSILNQQLEAGRAQFVTDEADLKKGWGAAYEQNVGIAKSAAQKFGVEPEKIDALQQVMGFKATMEFFHNLGTRLGEDKFVGNGHNPGNGGFGGVLTPAQAQARIGELRADSNWTASYLSGDKAKVEQMQQLQRLANGKP